MIEPVIICSLISIVGRSTAYMIESIISGLVIITRKRLAILISDMWLNNMLNPRKIKSLYSWLYVLGVAVRPVKYERLVPSTTLAFLLFNRARMVSTDGRLWSLPALLRCRWTILAVPCRITDFDAIPVIDFPPNIIRITIKEVR